MRTKEELLAYARKHYPIGTKHYYLFNDGQSDKDIVTVAREPRVNGDGIESGIEGGPGWLYIYESDTWATIVESVKPQEEYVLI